MVDQAPTAVRLTFSEPATPVGRGIEVLSPGGRHLELGQASASATTLTSRLGPAEPGTYRVSWKVVSKDSHPARGSFTFSVGAAGGPAGPALDLTDLAAVTPAGLGLQILARWLHFAGLALAAGSVLLMCLRPALENRLRKPAGVGIGLLLGSEPISVVAAVVSLGPLDAGSVGDVLGSGFGRLAGLRLGCALACWMVLGAVRTGGRGRLALPAPLAVLLLVDGSAAHLVLGGQPAAMLLNAVHEGAMAVWLGGLAVLLLLRLPLQGFARPAAAALGVAVASGGVLAVLHLNRPGDLLLSPYGLVLAAKILLVGAAAGVARLGSRRLEVAAIVAVVAAAGVLLSLPPPR